MIRWLRSWLCRWGLVPPLAVGLTLAEFEPYVEQALVALEWETARARWRTGLLIEREAIEKALPLAGSYGVERAPLQARLAQIAQELKADVTADRVSQHPVRSVPMDLITVEVARRALQLPDDFPILSLSRRPTPAAIAEAITGITQRWQTPHGQTPDEPLNQVEYVNHFV